LGNLVLSAIQLPIIKENLTEHHRRYRHAAPGSFRFVDCGTFSYKRKPED